MKLSRISHKFNTAFLTKQPNDIYLKSIFSLGIISLLAILIWVGGPAITWGDYAPLAKADKRIYIIAALLLIWLLKLLLWDLDTPHPFQYRDPQTRKKLEALHNRFQGAMHFLNKTTITRHGATVQLTQLPWYLLLGPHQAGKTSLLSHSNVNFVLQRQFSNQQTTKIESSEHCDWWVTRDIGIIDVPGKYLIPSTATHTDKKSPSQPALWPFFLQLLKKQTHKDGLAGIIIALPLPEIMQHGDIKNYQNMLRALLQRIFELHQQFKKTLPCFIVITKCDQLAGFNEFFAETGNDETAQAWGVHLPAPKTGEKIVDIFTHHFDLLIKKLNDQLIWRLHQERNPHLRPSIKDFPLQLEKLKELIQDVVKKASNQHLALSLQGVFLTSAEQHYEQAVNEAGLIDAVLDAAQHTSSSCIEPAPVSRAYFIKQFIKHGLLPTNNLFPSRITGLPWKHYTAYAASISVIAVAAALLGRDFEQGVRQANALQNNLSDYRLTLQQFHNPNEHLAKALLFLDTLQHSSKSAEFKLDISHLLSFYTYKSQKKANDIYHEALHTILIPEIKNYLEEYLKLPVNKNADDIYSTLKAYLMLGDTAHLQPEYIANTMRQILPKSLDEASEARLIKHITIAFKTTPRPLVLNPAIVNDTRKYLAAIPNPQLAYIILKNISNNNTASSIHLGTGNAKSILSNPQSQAIPVMFTANAYSRIISNELENAAFETMMGNWVLGSRPKIENTPEGVPALTEQLRTSYLNTYVDIWERAITNINIINPNNLDQADNILTQLTSINSPLLQLLQTVHANTYFEPIISISPKLQSLGSLIADKNNANNTLYQILMSLDSLHQFIQPVLNAQDARKAAFDAVTLRMRNLGRPDVITQTRLLAQQSPEPIKNWLYSLTNDIWRFLLQDAGLYINNAWQDRVFRSYLTDIANRYPFNPESEHEVPLDKFIDFFGNPGVVPDFYNHYLQALVDTSSSVWRWKSIDNDALPFSNETLRQVQSAMQIHKTFFPNGDNKLYMQFALQPYKLAKSIQTVKLNMNDKGFIDQNDSSRTAHTLVWPNRQEIKLSSVQLNTTDKKSFNREFKGDWGWFKLINQSMESMLSKKQILVNFSMDDQPAKYLVFTQGQANPFSTMDLSHFELAQDLINQQA